MSGEYYHNDEALAEQQTEYHEYVAENFDMVADQSTVRRRGLGRIIGSILAAGAVIGGAMLPNDVEGKIVDAEYSLAADPTCYGDYCSGQYADATHCDEDARTIAEATIVRSGVNGGVDVKAINVNTGSTDPNEVAHLELRESDRCGTVWGRLNSKAGTSFDVWGIQAVGAQQDGGYSQKRDIAGVFVGSPPAVSFGPMIYGRGREYRAYVEIQSNGIVTTNGSYWVEGPK